jgi:hypothetical protein
VGEKKDAAGEPRRRATARPAGGGPGSGPADVAEQHGTRKRWAIIAVTVLGLCAVAAGISVAVFSSAGGANRPTAGGTLTPQATTSASAQAKTADPSGRSSTGQPVTATPEPVAAVHGLAKSALRYPKRLKRQVLRWEAGPGGKALAAVITQMGSAMQYAGTGLYPTLKVSCTQLVSDIETARAGPAIPDAAMQRTYGRALAELSRAAANCHRALWTTGVGEDVDFHVHSTVFNLSRAEFAAGSKLIYNATADIHMP